MRTIRVAAVVAAAVGLGVFGVGCGPQPGAATTQSAGTSKTTVKTDTTTSTGTKPPVVDGLAGKAKAATEEVQKELAPLKDVLDKLNAKINEDEKTAGNDAIKMTAVGMLKDKRDPAAMLMKSVNDKLPELAAAKDEKKLDEVKKAVMESVEKLKTLLKDPAPAK